MSARSAPFPPSDLASRPLALEAVAAGERLYRIHRTSHGPLWFGPGAGNAPAYRFDAPGGEFGVCYLGRTREASFAETFLRMLPVRLIAMEDLAGRSLTTIHVQRTLRLVSLHGEGLVRMGATAEVVSGGYALSRAWSLALWAHPSAPDGIRYRCRHDDAVFAIALFDRAADAVSPESSVSLPHDAALLGALARRYGFGLVP